MGWKCAVAALIIVIASFTVLILYTRSVLERIRTCGADPLCQLGVVCGYTLVVILAVSVVLVLVDVVIQMSGQSERKLSLYPYAACISMGGRP